MQIHEILIIITFIIGYFFITIEHQTKINKTSIALLMAILCWVFQFSNKIQTPEHNLSFLHEHLCSISQVIFFLMGALTIVEIISVHKGFKMISDCIKIRKKSNLLWFIGFISFFLSCVLDNLTTTIIMVSLLRKMIPEGNDRLLLGGAVVVAANAGGAWTPIGDVTTTMLWIGGQLSTFEVIKALFLPSVICALTAFLCLSFSLKGEFDLISEIDEEEKEEPYSRTVFWMGIGCLIFVPIFKIITGLPPFMGVILGLGVLWLFTDIVHNKHQERQHLLVPQIITKIDMSGVLFFLGILLCVDALSTAGILNNLANWMDQRIGNTNVIALAVGLASAIVDNVPLVAATMGMYDLTHFPKDSHFWNLIAYCAGTGGSILVIGSAAGVAFMGLEKVDFFWYFKRVGIPATVGYFAGIGVYQLIN
jgi:NhaD family Na+/H+ antiporter